MKDICFLDVIFHELFILINACQYYYLLKNYLFSVVQQSIRGYKYCRRFRRFNLLVVQQIIIQMS